MNSLKYSNSINDVFQANNTMHNQAISNKFNQSPFRSRFQYPPLISNLQNPNISPQLKSLINSSPTLKALSASFLPVIDNSIPQSAISDEKTAGPLGTIFESNKPGLPELKPRTKPQNSPKLPNITKKNSTQRKNNIKFSTKNSPDLGNKTSDVQLPIIKQRRSLVKTSNSQTTNNTSSMSYRATQDHDLDHELTNRDSYTQNYVNNHDPRRLVSSQRSRDLESDLTERISSSKASCRSNNSKKMDLRFGSLLSEEGNYAMLKTYEDMIYQELVTLYPHLVTRQMYRTDTNIFQQLPNKFPAKKSLKLPPLKDANNKKGSNALSRELENLEVSIHKSNISRHLDQAMKIYDAIKLMKGQLTTYGNNFNFKNDRYLLNAFIDWKNNWHSISKI